MVLIYCTCGCGQQLEEFGSQHKRRNYINGHQNKGRFHSDKSKQKMSISHMGIPLSEKTKEKMSIAALGKLKSEKTKEKMSIAQKGNIKGRGNKGKLFSKERKQKLSLNHADFSKEKHPQWQGGITPLNFQIRNSDKYKEWRTQVFGRDIFTCQKCGIRGVWLEAHHIKRFSIIMKQYNIKTLEESYMCEELWDLDNGITLCKECHMKTRKYKNKRSD